MKTANIMVAIFFIVLINVGCRQDIKANDENKTLENPNLDELAKGLCKNEEYLTLSQNEMQKEFIGRVLGKKTLEEMNYDSIDSFKEDQLKIVEMLNEKNKEKEFFSCEYSIEAISCNDVNKQISENPPFKFVHKKNKISQKHILKVMDSMDIEACYIIGTTIIAKKGEEAIYITNFVGDILEEPIVFYILSKEVKP